MVLCLMHLLFYGTIVLVYEWEDYTSLSDSDQQTTKEDLEECFLAYLLITNSSTVNDSIKHELKNDYVKGSDQCLDTKSTALMFLDQYSKMNPPSSVSEGTSFAQKGGKGGKKKGGDKSDSDKKEENGGDKPKDPY